jgi:hypothetical protein
VALKDLIASIHDLFQAAVPKGFRIATQPVQLSQVEGAWTADKSDRIVFTMNT